MRCSTRWSRGRWPGSSCGSTRRSTPSSSTAPRCSSRGSWPARDALDHHELLQRLLREEADQLVPSLATVMPLVVQALADWYRPRLEAVPLRSGVDAAEAADLVARMALSYIGTPGRWDLSDPVQVRRLVARAPAGGHPRPTPRHRGGVTKVSPPVVDDETHTFLLSQAMAPPSTTDRLVPPAWLSEPLEERVVEAMLECIGRWGIAKTTADDIARTAGDLPGHAVPGLPGRQGRRVRRAPAARGRSLLPHRHRSARRRRRPGRPPGDRDRRGGPVPERPPGPRLRPRPRARAGPAGVHLRSPRPHPRRRHRLRRAAPASLRHR